MGPLRNAAPHRAPPPPPPLRRRRLSIGRLDPLFGGPPTFCDEGPPGSPIFWPWELWVALWKCAHLLGLRRHYKGVA